MDSASRIFWFSGTGNSLYAAKRLSEALYMPLSRITSEAYSGAVGGKGEKAGFVFPSYYGNIPRAVSDFVSKLEIKPETYIFAVVTMGAVGQGSIGALNKALKAKGLRLSYGRGIRMPRNYVIMYDPAKPEDSGTKLDKLNNKIDSIIAEIMAGKVTVKSLPVTASNLYRDIDKLDAMFNVSGVCTGCGQCEKICPVGNIRMSNGKPEWLHHCEHCVACISWCPAKAINYGDRTQTRRRYRNPQIKANELIR